MDGDVNMDRDDSDEMLTIGNRGRTSAGLKGRALKAPLCTPLEGHLVKFALLGNSKP